MKASKWMKRVMAGVISSALVLIGGMTLPSTVKATETTEDADAVCYVADAYLKDGEKFANWKTSEKQTIPTKEGFLFGGWYKDAEGTKALKAEEASNYDGDIYAKFVPSYVLSVKTQIDANTANKGLTREDNEFAEIRIITGVDNLKYQKIGAQILLANRIDTKAPAQSKVYQNLLIGTGENQKKLSANVMFGAAANYFSVWTVENIGKVNDAAIIYVRPYWVTMDGTTVYGLAKYVHVEDSYNSNRYISVPINMMSGKDAAAGSVTMSYDPDKFESVVGVEKGRVFPSEMDSNAVSGQVTVVGNDATVNHTNSDETLFASIRLKLKSDISVYENGAGNTLVRPSSGFFRFNLAKEFCNWNEEDVDAGVWNIQY